MNHCIRSCNIQVLCTTPNSSPGHNRPRVVGGLETCTIGTFNNRDEGYCIGRPRRRNYTDSAAEVILPRVPRLSRCTLNGIKPPRTDTLFSFEWSENRIRILLLLSSNWCLEMKNIDNKGISNTNFPGNRTRYKLSTHFGSKVSLLQFIDKLSKCL